MPTPLIAGPLRLEYDAGDIRCVRLGDEEILRRVYVVFQDRNWTSRPWRLVAEDIDDRGDSFAISLAARGSFDADPFSWEGEIIGAPDGTVTYTLRGATERPFLRNRLGICVLHPMAGFDGRACTITHPDGTTTESAFPASISPHQPFLDVAAMTYPVTGGIARLDFAGEVFETEDHRNWSDASYKTYCTPISLPFPVEVRPGEEVTQSVTLHLNGSFAPARPETPGDTVVIDVAADPRPLPSIGVQLTGPGWTSAELADLREMRLGHVHVAIDAASPDAVDRLRNAVGRARALDARLLIALRVGDGDPAVGLGAELQDHAGSIAGIWALDPADKVTARAAIDAWRSALGPNVPWGGGTDLYFTELNRQPPDTAGLAWTTFSLNPQVHAHDDRSVLQNTATLEVIAKEATRLAGATSVHVGPVSLRPRYNPNATDPASDISSTDLPSDVDARQRTWFAAAWTALALRNLSSPGTVSAVTIFEDLGWKGTRARDADPEDPAFPSAPGERFPVADVIAAISAATTILPTTSREPESMDALVLNGAEGRRAIIVNLADTPREARLTGAADVSIRLAPHDVVIIDLPGRAS